MENNLTRGYTFLKHSSILLAVRNLEFSRFIFHLYSYRTRTCIRKLRTRILMRIFFNFALSRNCYGL